MKNQSAANAAGRPSPVISVAIFVVSVSLMAWLRLWLFRGHFIALSYGLPLLLCLWHKDRRLLWAMAAAFTAMAALKSFWLMPDPNPNYHLQLIQWAIHLINLVVIAGVVHAVLNLTDRLQLKRAQLQTTNEELAARAEEISRQNQQLQAQSEELSRQNQELNRQTQQVQAQAEELLTANRELHKREAMLQMILGSLRGAGDEQDMLSRICEGLVQLLGESAAAAAVMERQQDQLVVRVQAGAEALRRDHWAFESSFAASLMANGSTAYIQDLATRPDLIVPEPARNKFRSLLATPLRVLGQFIGAVEVFSLQPRHWTKHEFQLVEWAAAECSLALEAMLLQQELQQSEDKFRQAHQRLEYHVRNTPLGVVEFDAAMRISAWNEGAQRIFGWQASEVLGQGVLELPWICEADRRKIEQVAAALATGAQLRNISPNRNLRKDGRVIWCEWYNSALTDASGKLQSVQSLVLDVTQRQEFQAQLEQVVAERTARLTDMVSELQHVSYAMVHDMRAPLRAMNGFADALAEGLSNHMAREEARDYCRRIRTGASRLDKLITDALNYTKAVLEEVPMAPVSLPDLVRGLLDTYPNFHPGLADIRVEGELPVVVGNESLLTECFSNLLGNAVKFVPPGIKPRVLIRAEPVPASTPQGPSGQGGATSGMEHGTRTAPPVAAPPALLPRPPSAFARIWVEDNGVGIPQPAQKRLFGMFQKLDSQYEGTGVGLAIVRKVVERMGGRVGAESEPGKGSRFWVELPLAASQHNPMPTPCSPAP